MLTRVAVRRRRRRRRLPPLLHHIAAHARSAPQPRQQRQQKQRRQQQLQRLRRVRVRRVRRRHQLSQQPRRREAQVRGLGLWGREDTQHARVAGDVHVCIRLPDIV